MQLFPGVSERVSLEPPGSLKAVVARLGNFRAGSFFAPAQSGNRVGIGPGFRFLRRGHPFQKSSL